MWERPNMVPILEALVSWDRAESTCPYKQTKAHGQYEQQPQAVQCPPNMMVIDGTNMVTDGSSVWHIPTKSIVDWFFVVSFPRLMFLLFLSSFRVPELVPWDWIRKSVVL